MTPDISATTKGKMPLFADLCCGCGGWLVAGELVKWKCVLSTDMCKSIEKWHKKNLDHKYMCGDLTKPEFQKQIINFLKPLNITALMSSPPCEPYALCGRHRPQDPRCKVAEACVDIACQLMPPLFLLENVLAMSTSKINPTLRAYCIPKLEKHGYKISLIRSDACKSGLPARRRRLFVVATTYPRDQSLQRHMKTVNARPDTCLSEFFPELSGKLVRVWPCHNSPAVINPDTQPCPPCRKSSFTDVDITKYIKREGDAGDIALSVPLSWQQRVKLTGMPERWHMPPPDYVCEFDECCARRRWKLPALHVACGNVLSPQQAVEILRHVNLPIGKRDLGDLPRFEY